MKTILLSTTLAALLALTGCSSKDATIDATGQAGQEGAYGSDMTTETVSGDEAVLVDGTADSSESTLSGLESQMRTVQFDFDKYVIRPDMQPRVVENSDIANNQASNYMIKLEGNCDEWGSDEYNYALGLRRANAVKDAMISEGVTADRITMVSYGESSPVCAEKTQECWARNRRVDFKLLP